MRGRSRLRFEQVYLDTVYRVHTAGTRFDLRVGRVAPALDRLLHRAGVREWAFVTACDPASRPLPGWRNRYRQARLWQILRAARVRLPGVGMPLSQDWAPESGAFVAPASRGRARRLGRQFGQNAVVAGCRGRPCLLVWVD